MGIPAEDQGDLLRYTNLVLASTDPEFRAGEDIADRCRDPDGKWCGFAARARVIALAVNSPVFDSPPSSIGDLAREELRGRVALADPRFGTTGSHLAILRSRLGPDRYRQLLRDLRANEVQIVSSNSSSRDRVLSGEAWVGLICNEILSIPRCRKPDSRVF